MNLRRWFFLFGTTILLGMLVACVVGLTITAIDPLESARVSWLHGISYNVLGTVLVGATLGAFSHMVFFAYLIVQMIGQAMLRKNWQYVQVAMTVLACMYTITFASPQSIVEGLRAAVLPLLLIVCSVPIIYWKVRMTHARAIIPSLFLLIAVTLLEAVPALRQHNVYAIAMMAAPLFVCNAWQLLLLHRLVTPKPNPPTQSEKPRRQRRFRT
ncbi:MAG: KinB-signaling pathway activation protein [Paenibacillaceae bacterium]|jgi:KinB signaling pathway activation protein|nr:KinB-signaling pathway activation protein [Paenibacillaceae bacterium]